MGKFWCGYLLGMIMIVLAQFVLAATGVTRALTEHQLFRATDAVIKTCLPKMQGGRE